MTAACPVPRANSRAASKRRASNAATSRRPWRVLAMLQHGIVPDDDHQSISRESLADSTAGRLGRQGDAEASYTEALSIYQRLDPPKRGFFQTEINRKGFEILISAVQAPDR